MRRLENELTNSKENVLLRNLSIKQFYIFFNFLKEVFPVMNLISEKYESKFGEGIKGMSVLMNNSIATPQDTRF